MESEYRFTEGRDQVNLKEGFRRICLVISILIFMIWEVILIILALEISVNAWIIFGAIIGGPVVFALSFGVFYGVFHLANWIWKGFHKR